MVFISWLGLPDRFIETQISSKPIITPSEGFQTSANGSGSEQSNNDKSTKLLTIRIGQWSLREGSRLNTRCNVVEAQNNTRPTGTDIQVEEENIGSHRPRLSQLEAPVRDHGNPLVDAGGNALAEQEVDSIEDIDYYQFDWFWMLIKIGIAAICMLIINFLAQSGNIVSNGKTILLVVAYILVQCFCYTATFVTLTRHHNALERIFETYLHLDSEWLGSILRYGAHFLFPLSLAGALTLYLLIWYDNNIGIRVSESPY